MPHRSGHDAQRAPQQDERRAIGRRLLQPIAKIPDAELRILVQRRHLAVVEAQNDPGTGSGGHQAARGHTLAWQYRPALRERRANADVALPVLDDRRCERTRRR